MNVWLLGHGGFYNRGCEAIVRSTASMLTERFGACRFTLWSFDPSGDAPALRGEPFRVFDARERNDPLERYRAIEKAPPWYGKAFARHLLRCIPGRPDVAISVGGDNFTLDYGVPDRFVGEGKLLLDAGVPFVIWGASVGPFAANPEYEKQVVAFFRRVSLLTVRESVTVDYLRSVGVVDNVVQVCDPAFVLATRAYQGPASDFLKAGNVVGFNISAIISHWFPGGDFHKMLDVVQLFLKTLLEKGFNVLLIPHVTAEGAGLGHNDEAVLRMVLSQLTQFFDRVCLLPGNVPASQIKWVISKCRFFVGARTHATIAAYSTGIPTLAISYSVKARGIARDIFGNEEYTVRVDDLQLETLLQGWEKLTRDEDSIRKTLEEKRPQMIAGAHRNVEALARVLATRRNWTTTLRRILGRIGPSGSC